MDKSIIQLVDELPTDNITVKVLKALDYVAPGQWNNLVGFDNTIRVITGETNPQVIQRIRDRAVVFIPRTSTRLPSCYQTLSND